MFAIVVNEKFIMEHASITGGNVPVLRPEVKVKRKVSGMVMDIARGSCCCCCWSGFFERVGAERKKEPKKKREGEFVRCWWWLGVRRESRKREAKRREREGAARGAKDSSRPVPGPSIPY